MKSPERKPVRAGRMCAKEEKARLMHHHCRGKLPDPSTCFLDGGHPKLRESITQRNGWLLLADEVVEGAEIAFLVDRLHLGSLHSLACGVEVASELVVLGLRLLALGFEEIEMHQV
jgi:hypothetical protein